MSIGNTKDYGNKGNNFPFQLKVLQGIASMISSLTGATSGAAKTTTVIRTSAAGTVTAGKNSASFANVGAANGTVKGVTLKPGETINFDAGAINNTLDAIAYDGTGTELLIIYIV